ncbi:MAG TPA: hypothetical protein ENH82_13365 [bacterium]|nr:hypothetical protein [bacterium]
METTPIQYCFTLPDGSKHFFDLQLNTQNLELYGCTPEILPEWTKLEFNQCPNCTISTQTHQHCPLAVNLVNIIESFERLVSYDKINVEVVTDERIVSHQTTAQKGIKSLMGLVIATCGCPHTAFFKSMVRFHLPLATREETIYRATSTYLLAQYFLKKEGQKADLDLKGLKQIYKNIQVVNISIAERLRAATKTDSSLNAIILLDVYAQAIPLVIEESLEEIGYLFAPFISETGSAKDHNQH